MRYNVCLTKAHYHYFFIQQHFSVVNYFVILGMNKLYQPILYFSRVLHRSGLKHYALQNLPQRTFSERILVDMRHVESIWRRSRDNYTLSKYLYKCFLQNSELLTYALNMVHFACDKCRDPSPIVYELVKTFRNYVDENNLPVSPSFEQKVDVLNSVLCLRNYNLVQLVCNVFKLHEEPLAFKQYTRNLITESKFFEAAFLISALNLQKEFDIKEVLFPLILEGNSHATRIYMTGHRDMQLEVAEFLDSLLETKNYVPFQSYKPKKAYRILSSLINIFKIPVDNCPNMHFIRKKAAINILTKRRDEQSVSEATWEEMIKDIIKDDEELKKHLLQKLIRNKDFKSAEKMAANYHIDISDLYHKEEIIQAEEISDEMNGDHTQDSEDSYETQSYDICDTSDEYLKFALRPEDIKIIDTKESFIKCIDDMSQNYNMIGIDSEWKPQFGLSKDRLALIQLAVNDKVYMLDMLILSECLGTEDWDRLMDDIFGNPKILKLGCGVITDVNMILESINGTKGKAIMFSHVLDMAIFYEKLLDVYPVEMHSYRDKACTRGLSSLCDIILGKPLNKEDRLCDWEKRPLMENQLEYAALDAHCLLQMYDKLKAEAIKKEMNFDHIVRVAIVLTTSQWKSKKKYRGVKNNQTLHVYSEIPVDQLRIVMDSTFRTQGRELRKLGADVIILEDQHTAETAIKASKDEERIVVCSSRLYHEVKHKVKQGFCYFFQESNTDDIQVAQFLRHFNAQVSTKSIYSRCLTCNSNHGLKLSTDDLKSLDKLHKSNTDTNSLLQDNLSAFSADLQTALQDIWNSNIKINVSSADSFAAGKDYAFLCKKCGAIS